VHICGVWSKQEGRVYNVGVPEEKEDGGFPSGEEDELILLDGLAWMQVDTSLHHLKINFIRIWTYPPLFHPIAHF
jgi:hypothetical protein